MIILCLRIDEMLFIDAFGKMKIFFFKGDTLPDRVIFPPPPYKKTDSFES